MKLLLLLFTSVKFAKLLTTGGTMLLSVVLYAFVFGWPYAVGFVALLLGHEMGHYLAAQRRGLNVGAPTFIPFVGAWIELKEQPMDVETEAYIALAGPLAGTVAALACYFYARHGGGNLYFALAYAGFMLNLFNMIPISPFDGGRVTAILSPRLWLLGVPILAALFYFRPSPMLILVAFLALPQLAKAWHFDATAPENQHYYTARLEDRIGYGFTYLALAGFLAVMTHDVHEMVGHLAR
ncbi:site-2 protease family protein [Chitinibacter fontanus]|uniref:Site-2 protease family protein n=1 Tax=Chitinibacter fontanus TaxID=1737446 RepID=A0A7D5V9T3_9NEIS|nr:site-2 protease family protein [Chitinibacter fontanus]QLI81616.1 site-2 protease family protein [Chitinibacter fontanus]